MYSIIRAGSLKGNHSEQIQGNVIMLNKTAIIKHVREIDDKEFTWCIMN